MSKNISIIEENLKKRLIKLKIAQRAIVFDCLALGKNHKEILKLTTLTQMDLALISMAYEKEKS